MIAHWRALFAVTLALAGCHRPEPKAGSRPAVPRPPKIEATLTLPNGDGRVHVIAIRDQLEVTRCLVVVPASGPASAVCPQKTLDIGEGSDQ